MVSTKFRKVVVLEWGWQVSPRPLLSIPTLMSSLVPPLCFMKSKHSSPNSFLPPRNGTKFHWGGQIRSPSSSLLFPFPSDPYTNHHVLPLHVLPVDNLPSSIPTASTSAATITSSPVTCDICPMGLSMIKSRGPTQSTLHPKRILFKTPIWSCHCLKTFPWLLKICRIKPKIFVNTLNYPMSLTPLP